VVHIYDQAGVLVWSGAMSECDIEAMATAAAAATDAAGAVVTVHVAYDGDTGERYSVRDWLQ
jgi:hypothetical protein